MANLYNIIKRPLLTEKTSILGEKCNRYSVIVEKSANKHQIKEAIELVFNVKVMNVKTAIIPGKVKKAGRHTKKAPSFKKATVQLKEGQKIEFFKGV